MPRPRASEIHPFIEELIEIYREKRGLEAGKYTLKDLSIDTGVPYETLRSWAKLKDGHHTLEAIMTAAARCGMGFEEFARGLMRRQAS